ncbi:hypothetical protein D9757_002306 [Collybiopsis confluens]|uniref:Plant basic secretory protein n=1 Tax=Collybiopsis confluens TaxID=2823264 RepID=A0A8H5MFD4_9AGAR|nr:hypothetical protein D9757_002306 [Collybiopsis confluens]
MAPVENPSWILPQFDFHVEDLGHAGAQLFFAHVPNHNPLVAMAMAVEASWRWLYGWSKDMDPAVKAPLVIQRVKRITLTLRPMDGVAHTFGNDEGSEKQVHFSTKHIENSYKGDTEEKRNIRVREEILGVLAHEIVHCYQYNGKATAPGGLIEGIAGEPIKPDLSSIVLNETDCVRLYENLGPPHWKRAVPGGKQVPDPERPHGPPIWDWDWNWDAGYERTAYFLDWIDTKLETSSARYYSFKGTTSSQASTASTAFPSAKPNTNEPISSPEPSLPRGRGLFAQALNARLEDTEWNSDIDLFLELTNWPRDALWEAYCVENK